MLILTNTGVPNAALVNMQAAKLQETASSVTDWSGAPDTARHRLELAVDSLGAVCAGRLVRRAGHEARARGDVSRWTEERWAGNLMGNNEEVDDALPTSSVASADTGEILFGRPRSAFETAYEMLLAGFHPSTCPYLAEKLLRILQTSLQRIVRKFAGERSQIWSLLFRRTGLNPFETLSACDAQRRSNAHPRSHRNARRGRGPAALQWCSYRFGD